jgi:hypothetical protein
MIPAELPRIPKIIHYTGPSKKSLWHPVWDKCLKSWKEHFPEPEYTHVYWSDEDLENLVKTDYLHHYQLYKKLPFHIMKIDFAEYLIMNTYGGIYHDLDMYCYKNFYDEIKLKKLVLLESSMKDEYIQNCMFASTPRAGFWMGLIEHIKSYYYPYPDSIEDLDAPKNLDPCFYIQDITGCYQISRHTLKTSLENGIDIFAKELYNPICNTYSPEHRTKHMLTNTWGKDYIDANIKNYEIRRKTEDFKNIRDFFKKNYQARPDVDKDAL